ncbi:hypothetical protein NQ317_002133 [Molorchus minor]|uniref:E3 ubiquitin-protein ligase Sina-like RING finger domain-containing protein n=1 Tax=Molorchus minor TaxID=1323400 RepID=A0ABQ9JVJ7_9CUCU|nr:hypothetical protein NQ317_002133 [Molorchus minor]
MGDTYLLTDEIAKTLRCSLCGSCLSVPPISIISEDGSKYKCGRCHQIKTHIETKVIMYENLAKHMIFPCIYKNCTEKLKWTEVKDHEKKCPHRTIVCPRDKCEDEFLYNQFTDHFQKKHPDSFHTDKFQLKNVHSYYNLDVLVKNDQTYIVIFDYDEVKYGISVCSLEPDDHQYEVVVSSDANKYSLVSTEQAIIRFDKNTHCFKCSAGTCKNEAHVYRYYRKGLLKRMTTKIDRDCIKRCFASSPLNYTLSIVEEKPEVDEDFEDMIVKDMIIDEVNEEEEEEEIEVSKDEETIRRMLECPNCFEYMQPPIYQCVTGHTTCKKCKETLTKCPTCEAAIENIRNLALEDAANSLRLSALIAEKATGQVDANKEAPVKEITCPRLNCTDVYDLKTIASHFKDKHTNNFHWNTIKIKNVYSYFNIDVLIRYGKTYIALFDYNDLYFGMTAWRICSEVKLMSENGKFSIVATDQKIVPFDDVEHCSKCLSGTCQNKAHKYRQKRKQLFRRLTTKFNRDNANRTFNYHVLDYVVNIIDGRKAFSKDFKLKRDKLFKTMYECKACKRFMSPPIQQCFAGHSFCKPCVAGKEKCPSCDAKIEATRNYAVEEMAEKIEVNCLADPGRVASVKRVAEHRDECPVEIKKAKIEEEKAREAERRAKEEKEKAEEARLKAEEEKRKAEEEKRKMEEEKLKTEEDEQKVDEEKVKEDVGKTEDEVSDTKDDTKVGNEEEVSEKDSGAKSNENGEEKAPQEEPMETSIEERENHVDADQNAA